MTTRSRLRVSGLLAVLVVLAAGSGGSAAPAPMLDCFWIAAAPTAPRTDMYCVSLDVDGRAVEDAAVYLSTDLGRTWTRRPAAGLTLEGDESPDALAWVHPHGELVVVVGTTLFVSADRGATFTTPLGRGSGLFFPPDVAAFADPVLGPSFVVTTGSTIGSTHILTPGRPGREALGSAFYNQGFLIPADFATTRRALAIAEDVEPTEPFSWADLRVRECAGDFTCVKPVASLGRARLRAAGSFGTGRHFAITQSRGETDAFALVAWLSSDDGATWSKWASVNAVLAPANAAGFFRSAEIREDPAHRGVLYLRVTVTGWAAVAPAEQLFRSGDAGRTWQRIGYAWGPDQPRRPGTLPFNDPDAEGGAALATFVALPNGELVVLSGYRPRPGGERRPLLFCSSNARTRWNRCA